MKARTFITIALVAMLGSSGCADGVSPSSGHWITGVDTTVVVGDVDFTHGGTRLPELPGPGVRRGPFQLQAFVVALESDFNPMAIEFVVTATNQADTSAVLVVPTCPLHPSLHIGADRANEPVWAWSAPCSGVQTRDVAPGETTSFKFHAFDNQLGVVPDGRYYSTLEFRLDGEVVTLRGGHVDLLLAVPGLAFEIETLPIGDAVRASVSVTNRREDSVYLQFGIFAMTLALYEDEDRERRVRQWYWTDSGPDVLAIRWIEPGETIDEDWWNADFRITDARQGLGSRTYELGIELELNSRVYRLPAGRVRVD
jgi:hypothetical protein